MTVRSPILSGSSLERLRAWLQTRPDQDVAGLEAFFRFLQPSPDLRMFQDVLGNFRTLRPLLEEMDDQRWRRPATAAFLALADALDGAPTVLASVDTAIQYPKRPLRGIVAHHPVYCLLTLNPPARGIRENPTRQQAFRRLQAYVLDAMLRAYEPEGVQLDEHGSDLSAWGDLASHVAGGELAVRKVARGNCPVAVLDLLPSDCRSVDELYNNVKERATTGASGPSKHFATRLKQLFECVLGIRGARRGAGGRGRKGGAGTGTKPFEPEEDEHYETVNFDVGWDDERVTAHVRTRNVRQFARAGILPSDAMEVDISYDSGEVLQVRGGDSPGLAARRSRGKLRAMAKRGQHLPHAYERLTLFEIQRLNSELAKLLRGQTKFRPQNVELPSEALVAFLALTFWTGTEADRVLQARLIGRSGRVPRNADNEQAYLDPEIPAWWPPRHPIRDAKEAKAHWIGKKYVEKVEKRLALPLSAATWSLLRRWLGSENGPLVPDKSPALRTRPLFDARLRDLLKDEASRFLQHVRDQDSQSRLRISHVDQHMFHALTDATGDSVEAALITGRNPFGVQTALYYYAPKIARLQAAYEEVTECLLAELREVSGRAGPGSSGRALSTPTTERIGSEICPTDPFLKSAVAEQIGKVEASAARMARDRSLTNCVAFHNDYTSYCILQLGYGTGLRAVHDPFPSLDDFDPQSGFLVVADKIKEHAPSTRVVWLPDLCQRQLEAYLSYLQGLAEHLVLLGRPFAASLLATTPGQRGTNLPGGRRQTKLTLRASNASNRLSFDTESPPLFFYLTEFADRWEPVGSTALSAHLGSTYPIPANCNRHYLRTRLREASVSGEMVDAFMGHGSFGQEPFGKFSTLAPFEFRQVTEPVIAELMTRAGWQVLSSTSGRRAA